MNKKTAAIIASVMIGLICITAYGMYHLTPIILKQKGYQILSPHTSIVHMRIEIYQHYGTPHQKLILSEYHSGALTDLGDNMTLYKLFGDSDMQYGSLNSSAYAPFISIGNDTGTLGTSSTVLPEEWYRELGTIDNEAQSSHNITCTISGAEIGGVGGTQTADCIGICLTETDDADDLWGYDTFTQVTGIDSTFTINIDFQITQSHS